MFGRKNLAALYSRKRWLFLTGNEKLFDLLSCLGVRWVFWNSHCWNGDSQPCHFLLPIEKLGWTKFLNKSPERTTFPHLTSRFLFLYSLSWKYITVSSQSDISLSYMSLFSPFLGKIFLQDISVYRCVFTIKCLYNASCSSIVLTFFFFFFFSNLQLIKLTFIPDQIKLVLDVHDFYLIIHQSICLIKRRTLLIFS